MAKPKKITSETPEIPTGKPVEISQVKAPEAEVAVEESEAKKSFRAYMADYKLRKPEKYALKEKEFINQLEKL